MANECVYFVCRCQAYRSWKIWSFIMIIIIKCDSANTTGQFSLSLSPTRSLDIHCELLHTHTHTQWALRKKFFAINGKNMNRYHFGRNKKSGTIEQNNNSSGSITFNCCCRLAMVKWLMPFVWMSCQQAKEMFEIIIQCFRIA